MTTKTMERGRVKCHQYWESTVDESCVYGSFTVKTTAVDSNEDYTVTSLEIRNSKVRVKLLMKQLNPCVSFTSDWWNQKRITLAVYELAGLWRSRAGNGDVDVFATSSRETSRNGGRTRWYVGRQSSRTSNYCSLLGWHRTHRNIHYTRYLHNSTGGDRYKIEKWVVLDIKFYFLGFANIRGAVEKIRAQRAYSIQMPDQYVFCHLALIEWAIEHKHLSPDTTNMEGFDENDNSDSE